MRGLLIAVLIAFGGCAPAPPPVESPGSVEPRVWMVRRVSEGRQCEPYTKPDFLAPVRDAGVEIHESRVEPLMVCQACSVCPAFAAEIYVLVDESDRERVGGAGFRVSEQPARQ
jgi:hypothetical protein